MVSVVMNTASGYPISDDHFGSQDVIPQIDGSSIGHELDRGDGFGGCIHQRNSLSRNPRGYGPLGIWDAIAVSLATHCRDPLR